MTHRQEQILPFSFGTTIKENQNTRGRTMGLQNIFDMIKAERYTQDGREEIIKAQKETEDARRTYKNGEISEKTGLMKTANGWVKPRSGKATGAKTGPGESPNGTGPLSPAKRKAERISKIQKETGKAAPYGRTLKGTPKTPDDNPLTERTQARVESKPAAEKAPGAASKHDTDPQTYIVKKNDELRKMYLNEKDPAKKAAMKKALQKQASMMESESFAPGAEADNKAAREAVHEMNMKSKEAAANRAYERRQKEHDPDYKPEGKVENKSAKEQNKPTLGNGNEKWKKQRDHWNEEFLHMETSQGDRINIYQKKNGDFVVYTNYRGTDMTDQSKPFKTSEEAQAYGEAQAEYLNKQKGKVNGTWAGTNGQPWESVTFGDSAPLTGDCKIRVKKS